MKLIKKSEKSMETINLLLGSYSQGQWILAKKQTAIAGNYLLCRQSNFVLCTWKLRYKIDNTCNLTEAKLNIKPARRKNQSMYVCFGLDGSF